MKYFGQLGCGPRKNLSDLVEIWG